MTEIRVVTFKDPETFLQTVQSYDDSFMNFALGSLLDRIDPARPGGPPTKQDRTLLAVYKGDNLL